MLRVMYANASELASAGKSGDEMGVDRLVASLHQGINAFNLGRGLVMC